MAEDNDRVFSNVAHRVNALRTRFSAMFKGKPVAVVWICGNALSKSPDFTFAPRASFTRILLVFEGRPVSLEALNSWRIWAQSKGAMELKVDFVDLGVDDEAMCQLVEGHCQAWMRPLPQRETPRIVCGEWVKMPVVKGSRDDPALLTMLFGSMGELLTRMDLIRKRFERACPMDETSRAKYLKEAAAMLAKHDHQASEEPPKFGHRGLIDCLPKPLMIGETGVGKTLFVRYLAGTAKVTRIAIPEWIGKEDMLEYDLFGYAAGAYTGGRNEGSLGMLLENVGRVVFLDELGEASDIIQAKLLAYLDDYCVRPRGWNGKPFFCPTMVVGATNKDLSRMKGFRKDLLARFTDVNRVPPLREREESFPFILDCLLQRDSINPGCEVKEIGDEAYKALRKHRFPGNFRELETLLRNICETVIKDGRNYITRKDLPF